jgi:hypothetical protein
VLPGVRFKTSALVGAILALLALRPSLNARWYESGKRGTLIEDRFAEARQRLRDAGVSEVQFIADGAPEPEAYYKAQFALAPITLVRSNESQQYTLVDFVNGMNLPATAARLDADILYERDGLALLRQRRRGREP